MEHLPLESALKAAGNQQRLAEICGVTQPTVSGWFKTRQKRLPAEHVFKVSAATGIAPEELRPDMFPPHQSAA